MGRAPQLGRVHSRIVAGAFDALSVAASIRLRATAVQPLVSRPGRLVARAETPDGPIALKIDDEPGTFRSELETIATLAAGGLPVPDVRAHRDDGPAVLALSWIDGTGMSATRSRPRSVRPVCCFAVCTRSRSRRSGTWTARWPAGSTSSCRGGSATGHRPRWATAGGHGSTACSRCCPSGTAA
jgi:hypothetical protein